MSKKSRYHGMYLKYEETEERKRFLKSLPEYSIIDTQTGFMILKEREYNGR